MQDEEYNRIKSKLHASKSTLQLANEAFFD